MVTLMRQFIWCNQKAFSREIQICKLRKSIYELKQASRQWYHKFYQVIVSFGFETNAVEDCVYHKFSGSRYIFLVLYVVTSCLLQTIRNCCTKPRNFYQRNLR